MTQPHEIGLRVKQPQSDTALMQPELPISIERRIAAVRTLADATKQAARLGLDATAEIYLKQPQKSLKRPRLARLGVETKR